MGFHEVLILRLGTLLQLQLGVDESYNLVVSGAQQLSGAGGVKIEVGFAFLYDYLLLDSNIQRDCVAVYFKSEGYAVPFPS